MLVAPVALWAIATIYVPIITPGLRPIEAWGVALGILAAVVASLAGHALAHVGVTKIGGGAIPPRLPIHLCGDAAQVWAPALPPGREALVAIAGPAANLLIAAAGYLLWDGQFHPYLNGSALFVALFNLGIALVNLAPGFPLDGGRVTRALVWEMLRRPGQSTAAARWLGILVISGLVGWGVLLAVQQVRFSLVTGITTLLLAGLLALALWGHPAAEDDRLPADTHRAGTFGRWLTAGLVTLAQIAAAGSLLPTLSGLRAPGFAATVVPMISVPEEYYYPPEGDYILTTIIDQAPITLGQWVAARWNPAIEIVPPERLVPAGTSPQALMRRNYVLLQESETIATAVALRLAGFEVAYTDMAVLVTSVVPESPAAEFLQAGDRILALNGDPLNGRSELITALAALDPDEEVTLLVERVDQQMEIVVPLMAPLRPGDPPRLGVAARSVASGVNLPFQVQIDPKKIVGGPSAGLMFTLTIYDLVTPEDLTGGRRIAGTGTVDLDGEVGRIGGVVQKVISAERAGAEYFLVPPENYEGARNAARHIKVIEVRTVDEAIDFLRSLPPREP